MIIMVREGATEKEMEQVTAMLKDAGCGFKIFRGCIIAITEGKPPSHDKIKAIPCVQEITKTI